MTWLACWRLLLCLHDIGKFAKRFQAKEPSLYPGCFGDDPAGLTRRYDHGAGGLNLFDADPTVFHLSDRSSVRAWRPLVSAIMGHHGSPPEPGLSSSLAGLRPEFGKAGLAAARAFIRQTYRLFRSDSATADSGPSTRDTCVVCRGGHRRARRLDRIQPGVVSV